LEVGARLFVERGIARVSVEQLVEEAGVSRATFYGSFANKIELAAAILSPVFDSGSAALVDLRSLTPRSAAEALIDVYLYLWRNHRTALLLTGSFDGVVFPYIKSQHDSFNTALENVLRTIDAGGLLKNGSPGLTLAVLAKTAIPLLRVYKDCEGLEKIYRESMYGLIIKD
jgi:AcrR family transcriptional regulator